MAIYGVGHSLENYPGVSLGVGSYSPIASLSSALLYQSPSHTLLGFLNFDRGFSRASFGSFAPFSYFIPNQLASIGQAVNQILNSAEHFANRPFFNFGTPRAPTPTRQTSYAPASPVSPPAPSYDEEPMEMPVHTPPKTKPKNEKPPVAPTAAEPPPPPPPQAVTYSADEKKKLDKFLQTFSSNPADRKQWIDESQTAGVSFDKAKEKIFEMALGEEQKILKEDFEKNVESWKAMAETADPSLVETQPTFQNFKRWQVLDGLLLNNELTTSELRQKALQFHETNQSTIEKIEGAFDTLENRKKHPEATPPSEIPIEPLVPQKPAPPPEPVPAPTAPATVPPQPPAPEPATAPPPIVVSPPSPPAPEPPTDGGPLLPKHIEINTEPTQPVPVAPPSAPITVTPPPPPAAQPAEAAPPPFTMPLVIWSDADALIQHCKNNGATPEMVAHAEMKKTSELTSDDWITFAAAHGGIQFADGFKVDWSIPPNIRKQVDEKIQNIKNEWLKKYSDMSDPLFQHNFMIAFAEWARSPAKQGGLGMDQWAYDKSLSQEEGSVPKIFSDKKGECTERTNALYALHLYARETAQIPLRPQCAEVFKAFAGFGSVIESPHVSLAASYDADKLPPHFIAQRTYEATFGNVDNVHFSFDFLTPAQFISRLLYNKAATLFQEAATAVTKRQNQKARKIYNSATAVLEQSLRLDAKNYDSQLAMARLATQDDWPKALDRLTDLAKSLHMESNGSVDKFATEGRQQEIRAEIHKSAEAVRKLALQKKDWVLYAKAFHAEADFIPGKIGEGNKYAQELVKHQQYAPAKEILKIVEAAGSEEEKAAAAKLLKHPALQT